MAYEGSTVLAVILAIFLPFLAVALVDGEFRA